MFLLVWNDGAFHYPWKFPGRLRPQKRPTEVKTLGWKVGGTLTTTSLPFKSCALHCLLATWSIFSVNEKLYDSIVQHLPVCFCVQAQTTMQCSLAFTTYS